MLRLRVRIWILVKGFLRLVSNVALHGRRRLLYESEVAIWRELSFGIWESLVLHHEVGIHHMGIRGLVGLLLGHGVLLHHRALVFSLLQILGVIRSIIHLILLRDEVVEVVWSVALAVLLVVVGGIRVRADLLMVVG